MKGQVEKLFIKSKTNEPLSDVVSLTIRELQILGQKKSQPFRSALLVSQEDSKHWGVEAGEFRENIFIKNFDLSKLVSGDEIKISAVHLRVTFNCEPCKKMSHISSVDKLKGRRGVLVEFLCDGDIQVGDNVKKIHSQKYEYIPGEYYERIAWYLENKLQGNIFATDLLWQVGVAQGLVRVLPQIMEKHKMKNRDRVMFKAKKE